LHELDAARSDENAIIDLAAPNKSPEFGFHMRRGRAVGKDLEFHSTRTDETHSAIRVGQKSRDLDDLFQLSRNLCQANVPPARTMNVPVKALEISLRIGWGKQISRSGEDRCRAGNAPGASNQECVRADASTIDLTSRPKLEGEKISFPRRTPQPQSQ